MEFNHCPMLRAGLFYTRWRILIDRIVKAQQQRPLLARRSLSKELREANTLHEEWGRALSEIGVPCVTFSTEDAGLTSDWALSLFPFLWEQVRRNYYKVPWLRESCVRSSEARVHHAVKKHRLSSVMFIHNDQIDAVSQGFIERLRSEGVVTAINWGGPLNLSPANAVRYLRAADFVVTCSSQLEAEIRGIGARDVLMLPHSVNTRTYKPLKPSAEDRARFGATVSFVGRHYPSREEAICKIDPSVLSIWGPGWERSELVRRNPSVLRGGSVSGSDMCKIINLSRISLNSHGGTTDEGLAFGNQRLFEIPACAGFQFVEDHPDVDRYFRRGSEIETFSSPEELAEKVRYYLADDTARDSIRRAGYARAISDHTVKCRMKTYAEYVSKKIS
ncbi:MAG: glycosyltransferase [Planctomycetes bacterium]|nr:glycosyltransferase [Planctomycetota bacterium]